MQKIVMNSASDGAVRRLIEQCGATPEGLVQLEENAFQLFNDYFRAVKHVFGAEWDGMNPKTSRLRHGAGLVEMGFVMEQLCSADLTNGKTAYDKFVVGLEALRPHTAWTRGNWQFSEVLVTTWNGVQNTPTDINVLTDYLVRMLKRSLRRIEKAAA